MNRSITRLLSIALPLVGGVCHAASPCPAGQATQIGELIATLGEPGWQKAVDALAAIGQPAVAPLARSLKDRSVKPWPIQARAVDALAKIGTPPCQPLLGALEHRDSSIRWQAAWVLGKLKSPVAVPGLVETLDDPDWIVRNEVAVALAMVGSPDAVPPLVEVLNGPAEPGREEAAWALGELNAGQAAGDLQDPPGDAAAPSAFAPPRRDACDAAEALSTHFTRGRVRPFSPP